MPQSEHSDVLVLGSGTGGKLIAWHMAQSGRRTAHGETLGWRLMSEHPLYAEQERDREFKNRAPRTDGENNLTQSLAACARGPHPDSAASNNLSQCRLAFPS
jgi:choline dehydrogenase-like flavoprotein